MRLCNHTLSPTRINNAKPKGKLYKLTDGGGVRHLPRYPQLRVTLLGRLAVDQSTKGQGFGEHLLLDALRRSLAHADQIAAIAVVVDAKDEAAAAFYRYCGFLTVQAQPSRLFVPMRLVAQVLG